MVCGFARRLAFDAFAFEGVGFKQGFGGAPMTVRLAVGATFLNP